MEQPDLTPKMNPVLSFLFKAAFTVLVAGLLGGVTSILWGWFVVPLGVPPISVAHAVGLSAVVSSFLIWRNIQDHTDEKTKTSVKLIIALFIGAFLLGEGWVLVQFMD